jgi:hypothetical protein
MEEGLDHLLGTPVLLNLVFFVSVINQEEAGILPD